ncbi:MAG: DUF998 domain-containing protein [Chloroflexi bacterium]|nr:DUF998 domain-containing protein [Chloroflexota bacterium]
MGNGPRFTRGLLLAGVAAPIGVWVVSLVLGAVSPGFDPVRRSISALANTPAGGLMTATFLVTGVLELMFALGLSRVLGVTRGQARAAAAVIAFLGLLIVIFALFPTDPPGVPRTSGGRIHLFTALAYALLLPATGLVLAWLFGRDARWHRYRRTTLLVALVQVVLFPVLVIAVVGELRPYLGLVERVTFAIPSLWQAAVALVGVRLLDERASALAVRASREP